MSDSVIYNRSPRAVQKAMRAASKDMGGQTIEKWHAKYVGLHFKAGAFARYGYANRTKAYQDRKQRTHGHRNPLVWSGESRRMVMREVRISATSKTATGKLRTPPHFKYRRGHADKDKELRAVTQGELAWLTDFYKRGVIRGMERARD